MTNDQRPPRPVSLNDILEAVSGYFGLSPGEICSPSRVRAIREPRQIAAYLAHKFTHYSLAYIGGAMNRDHATILHSIRKVKDRILSDPDLLRHIKVLEEILNEEGWHARMALTGARWELKFSLVLPVGKAKSLNDYDLPNLIKQLQKLANQFDARLEVNKPAD